MIRIPALWLCLLLVTLVAGCGSEDVDLIAPSIALTTVNGQPASGELSKTFNSAITFAGTMEIGAEVSATVNTDVPLTLSYDAGAGTWNGTLSAPAQGTNVVTVTASDRRGNLSNLYFTVLFDSVAPTLSFNRFVTPTANTAQTLGGLVEAGATVTVTAAAGTTATCTPVTVNNGLWSCPVAGLTAGNNTFIVAASDLATNTTTLTPSPTLVFAAGTPLFTISDPLPVSSNSATLRGTVSLPDNHVLQVTAPTGVTAGSVDTTTTPGEWSCLLSGLLPGNNLVQVTMIDSTSPDVAVVTAATVVQYDSLPPLVAAVAPSDGNPMAAPITVVTATFSEALDPASVTATTMTLVDANQNSVPGSASYDAASKILSFTPATPLASGTFTATIANSVKDLAGNAVAGYSWTFTVL